jgi:hypothetical protein
MRPIGAGQHGTNQANREDKQDDAAATTAAAAASKTEPSLQPVGNFVNQEEFEQTRKASGTVIHVKLLETGVSLTWNTSFDKRRLQAVRTYLKLKTLSRHF